MQNAMHGDLLGSKSPSFIFDGPDGVGMDGILSDSNDSSSSSTENGLNSFLNVANSVMNSNNNNQLSHMQLGQHQVFHQVVHPNNSNNSSHLNGMNGNMQSNTSSIHNMMPSEKRKHDDGLNGNNQQVGHDMQAAKKLPPPNGKKTKGRVKIKMEFIDNKLRRYTTFSKRKTGIMKKAYELSTLTGTQVMLLVASETGHVYTFATRKLQPMITSEAGKALIQTCLNSPDPANAGTDQRMCATGFEETDLTYTVNEDSSEKEKDSSESVSGLQYEAQQQQQPQQQGNTSSQSLVTFSTPSFYKLSEAAATSSVDKTSTKSLPNAGTFVVCANSGLNSANASSSVPNAASTATTLMNQTHQGLVYATSSQNGLLQVFPDGLILNLGQSLDTVHE